MMFERYTDRARRALVIAQGEAVSLGHSSVGMGHLLLGLIGEDGGVAAVALKSLGASMDEARSVVRRAGDRATAAPPGPLPFTPGLGIVLREALHESLRLGHSYIATEHLLLSLIAASAPGASPLVAIGVSPDDARAKVLALLRGYEEAGKRPLAPDPAAGDDDPLSSALTAIRDREWSRDVPVLLKALGAVLKQADEWDAEVERLRTLVNEDTEANATTQAARSMIASTRWDSARSVRATIARELTGEAGDGHD
jgi:ATP-dependent Clp protease ATP-binding subunit ClpA